LARERIESALPRFVAGKVRSCLISHAERYACLAGESVWPHDADQQNKIDTLRMFVTRRPPRPRALQLLEELDFDAFIAFMDRLIRNFPGRAKELLLAFGTATNDNAKLFNSIEILREDDDFDLNQEIEITQRCDSETLFELYRDLIHQELEDTSIWEDRLTDEMQRMADEVSVANASLEDIEFTGGYGISFSAIVSLDLEGQSQGPYGPDGETWTSQQTFSCEVTGYLTSHGFEIGSIR
jgi:hypothetical protein